MTRFTFRSWKSRILASALALAVAAPLAASPALADSWHHDRDDWRHDRHWHGPVYVAPRPVYVAPRPVYVAPVYPAPVYAPPPPAY